MFEDQLFTKVLKDQAMMIKTGHATTIRFFGMSKPLKGQTKFWFRAWVTLYYTAVSRGLSGRCGAKDKFTASVVL